MTTMRFVYAIRRAAMLGLVALWCLAPMRSASAQVAIAGNYYEEYKTVACIAATSSCQLVFSATPQLVFVTDVSCSLTATQPINQMALGVSDSATPVGVGGLRRLDFFVPQLLTSISYAAKFKTSFLFGSGKFPSIFLNMTAVGQAALQCKIVGTLLIP
jgi:hypothetical protein